MNIFISIGISKTILSTMDKKKENWCPGQSFGLDDWGKHSNKPKKISDEVLNPVREHISSFERVESHYCRASTSREYLNETLNINKMYSKYKEYMSENNYAPIASEYRYWYIFNHEFKISFHQPKKDQCDECTSFNFLSDIEKQLPQYKNIYVNHIKHKNQARQMMETDKKNPQMTVLFCALHLICKKCWPRQGPKYRKCSIRENSQFTISQFSIWSLKKDIAISGMRLLLKEVQMR